MNVDLKVTAVNTDFIKKKLQQAEVVVKKVASKTLKKGFAAYAETASRQMPPPVKGSRSRSIPAKLYKREIYSIDELYKNSTDEKFKRVLISKKIAGFKFAVYVYKDLGKHKKLIFGKTERELKSKYGRIKYRGLYKWLWGAKLHELGETSTMFSRLLTKSPALKTKENLAAIFQRLKNDSTEIIATWKARGIDYFANRAKYAAERAMKTKLKKTFQENITNELKKI